MIKRVNMFGLALVTALAFAGVAAGSASAISSTLYGKTFQIEPTSEVVFKSGADTLVCGLTGSGGFTAGSSGEVFARFTHCRDSLYGVLCTTSGFSSGTIVPSELKFELVYLDAKKTKYGVLLKPKSGSTFAQFKCGGLISHEWIGGVLSEIESPKLNEKTTIITQGYFPKATYEQNWQYIEEDPAQGFWNLEDMAGYGGTGKMSVTSSLKWKLSGGGELLP